LSLLHASKLGSFDQQTSHRNASFDRATLHRCHLAASALCSVNKAELKTTEVKPHESTEFCRPPPLTLVNDAIHGNPHLTEAQPLAASNV
ncbi:hypothetical protein ACJRO7_016891, partial [Eucalyptus globulus]